MLPQIASVRTSVRMIALHGAVTDDVLALLEAPIEQQDAQTGANQPLNDITNPKTGLSAAHPVFAAVSAAIAEAVTAAKLNFLIMCTDSPWVSPRHGAAF